MPSNVFRPLYARAREYDQDHNLLAGGIKNATITGHFEFVFEENSVREIAWLSWRHGFPKLRFMIPEKPAFSNSPGLKSVFEKLRCRVD